ncbi:MAG: sugar phosphate isomerase/epimerase [Chloroflexota bacterium]|nr:sugar phosphate isomerase/epimerase [Chloroflexota bacterium]
MEHQFVVSGFGDEISAEPREQLAVLRSLGITHLDLRGAQGRNVLDFGDDDVARLRSELASAGARVAMVASPIGKSDIEREAAYEEGRLETAIRLADAFETPLIRVFSFYLPNTDRARCREEVVARLSRWAARAEATGTTLLLENELNLWGERPEQCAELLAAVDSEHLRMTLDTGNFASIGVASSDAAYPLLRPWLAHCQIKDVRTADRAVVAPGEGDGQIPELLAALVRAGYRGYLSLEPHLALAGKAGGFSGPELFGQAARALARIVERVEREAAANDGGSSTDRG